MAARHLQRKRAFPVARTREHLEPGPIVMITSAYKGERNDDAANREVAALTERLGFAPVILGSLTEGGRLQHFGAPLVGLNLLQHPNPGR